MLIWFRWWWTALCIDCRHLLSHLMILNKTKLIRHVCCLQKLGQWLGWWIHNIVVLGKIHDIQQPSWYTLIFCIYCLPCRIQSYKNWFLIRSDTFLKICYPSIGNTGSPEQHVIIYVQKQFLIINKGMTVSLLMSITKDHSSILWFLLSFNPYFTTVITLFGIVASTIFSVCKGRPPYKIHFLFYAFVRLPDNAV